MHLKIESHVCEGLCQHLRIVFIKSVSDLFRLDSADIDIVVFQQEDQLARFLQMFLRGRLEPADRPAAAPALSQPRLERRPQIKIEPR